MGERKWISDWYLIRVCSGCQRRLDLDEWARSGGVCPKCGKDSHSTICNTKNVILREIKFDPWWKFWDRKPSVYEGKDDFSKQWLLTH